MKYNFMLLFLLLSNTLFSCKKHVVVIDECFANETTTSIITNEAATVKLIGSDYFLYTDAQTNAQLTPCNLPTTFKENNLKITVSGKVKFNPKNDFCNFCNDFVITNILKR